MVASEPLSYHLDLQSSWCDHFLRTDPAMTNTPRHRTHHGYARVGVFTIKLWELDDIQLQKIEAIHRKHARYYKCSSYFVIFSMLYFWVFNWIQVVGGRYNEMMYNSHDPCTVEEFQVCSDTIPIPSKWKASPH